MNERVPFIKYSTGANKNGFDDPPGLYVFLWKGIYEILYYLQPGY